MSQVLITFAYSSFFFFSEYLPCHTWRLFLSVLCQTVLSQSFHVLCPKTGKHIFKILRYHAARFTKYVWSFFNILYERLNMFFNKKEQTKTTW